LRKAEYYLHITYFILGKCLTPCNADIETETKPCWAISKGLLIFEVTNNIVIIFSTDPAVCLTQHGPTTFYLRAILQRRDNSRATSNKMMYELIDSQYLKL